MAKRKLGELPDGAKFRWSGVLFVTRPEVKEFEGREVRSVVYLEPGGLGYAQPGDKGLIPNDEPVEEELERKPKKAKVK